MPWNVMPHFSNYSNQSTNFVTDKVNIPKYLTKSFISRITRVFKVGLKILI